MRSAPPLPRRRPSTIPLFVVKLEIGDERVDIGYETLDACLSDGGLKTLFDLGAVTQCTIYCGDTRITRLPVMAWDRLNDQLVSNSTTILRRVQTSLAWSH